MRYLVLTLVAVPLGMAALASCGGDGPGDAATFCGEVAANREAIVTSPASADEIDDFLGLYRRIGRTAPLAIDSEWDALISNYETASTVEPGDPESVQRVLAQAVRTERAAVTVHYWLRANCDVDIGEVATMAADRPAPPSTSVPATVPPEDDAD